MDIFTTQLTRVVPTKLQPKSLKVKKLLKEAATGELTDDPDHLENHDYYFDNTQESEQQETKNKTPVKTSESEEGKENKIDKDSSHHLDIYV